MKIKFKPHIRKDTRTEVRRLALEYGIEDEGGRHWLTIYADADTHERNCQDIVDAEGLTVTDRFSQRKAHPLLAAIRDARSQKMQALKGLALDLEPVKPIGRPPGR